MAKIDSKALQAQFQRHGFQNKVKPVFTTDIKRTSWNLSYRDAQIELSLDEGRILAGRRGNDVCEAELELIDGTPRRLLELAMEIGEAFQQAAQGNHIRVAVTPAPGSVDR